MNKLFIIILVLILSSLSVFGTTLASNSVLNAEFNLNLSQSVTINTGDYLELNSMSVIAYNPDFRTSLYLRIRDEFNANQSIYYSSKVVEETPTSIRFDLSGVTLNSERKYWFEFSGVSTIKMYGDNSTVDGFTGGQIYGYPNNDLFFSIDGTVLEDTRLSLTPATRDKDTFVQQYYYANYLYTYFNATNDGKLDDSVFWTKQAPSGGFGSQEVVFQIFNCTGFSVNKTVESCFDNLFTVTNILNDEIMSLSYNESFPSNINSDTGYLERIEINYSDYDTQILFDGGEIYRFQWRHPFGGSYNNGYYMFTNLTPTIKEQYPFIIGGGYEFGVSGGNYMFYENQTMYSDVNLVLFGSCSGRYCDPESLLPATNTTEVIDPNVPNVEDEEAIFGEMDGQNILSGLFVTFLLLVAIVSLAYSMTSSFYVVLSVAFKVMVFSVLWDRINFPFYIPVMILMLMIGVKLFAKTFLNSGGND